MSPCVRIAATLPAIGHAVQAFFGESVSFRMVVHANLECKTDDIVAEMITNVPDTFNPSGEWINRRMRLEKEDIIMRLYLPFYLLHTKHKLLRHVQRFGANVLTWLCPFSANDSTYKRLVFLAVILPTNEGHFEATARIRCGSEGDFCHASSFRQNAFLNVYRSIHHVWATGPKMIEILPNLYLGNLIAACNASRYGFDVILNTTEECDVYIPDSNRDSIIYKKVPIEDGVAKPIPVHYIEECVRFALGHKDKKVLVHCRASKFRSASIMVAIVYRMLASQGGFTYDDAVQFVQRKKPDTAMHVGLRDSLLRLWPTKQTTQITVPAHSPLHSASTRSAPAPHVPLAAGQLERQR